MTSARDLVGSCTFAAAGRERRACGRRTRARRWVFERATSWFNRCRKLLIRWENKPQNYLALVHFAAAIVVWRGLVG